MVLGPGPPQKKGNRDKDKVKAESSRGLRSGGVGSSSMTGTSSADTVVEEEEIRDHEAEVERQSGDGWNRRRYQREDEILWGVDGDELSGMISRGTSGSGSYYIARNPAVNDLHPPVVSTQPTHRSETKWMLQPPPSARIMEGKIKATRSRSGSGTSNKSDSSRRKDDVSLGRKVGERLMEEKVKRGEHPPESAPASTSMLRLPSKESTRSEAHPPGQRHDRDRDPFPTTALPTASHTPPRPGLPTISSASLLAIPRPALLPKNSSSSLPSPIDLSPRSSPFDPYPSPPARIPAHDDHNGERRWPEWRISGTEGDTGVAVDEGLGRGRRDGGGRWSVDF